MSDGSTSEVINEIESYKDTLENFDDTAAIDAFALFIEREGIADRFSHFLADYTSGQRTP